MFDLESRREPERSDSVQERLVGTGDRSAADSTAFRLGRYFYGSVLAFMALDNLRQFDERTGYAESKGAPRPGLSVGGISLSLLLGGLGIATWRRPRAAAVGVMTFFASVTPVMHDFWAVDDEQEQTQQLIHFLKNSALFGAALAFFGAASHDS